VRTHSCKESSAANVPPSYAERERLTRAKIPYVYVQTSMERLPGLFTLLLVGLVVYTRPAAGTETFLVNKDTQITQASVPSVSTVASFVESSEKENVKEKSFALECRLTFFETYKIPSYRSKWFIQGR
jgi:hypothetical protein